MFAMREKEQERVGAKATKTIKQFLSYKPEHASWFAETQALFNRVVSFYFEVIAAHQLILELSSKDALTALEKLTHATEQNPDPAMPLTEIAHDIPSMFRRAAIHAALGQAKSFYTHLAKWCRRKEQVQAREKKYSIRPEFVEEGQRSTYSECRLRWSGRSCGSLDPAECHNEKHW
jgi:hypothetical protein